jgi:tRNA threonylcarbamoyladenosine biosynthesis protein TsaB
MANILSLESSTSVCSAAIHKSGKLVVSTEMHVPQSASTHLAVMVEELFKRAEIDKTEVNAIAVSAGPGSYTGLRIGVSLAKGLSFSLGIPLISVNTLLVMSHYVRSLGCVGHLCPMIDARRMEVYCLLMDSTDKLIWNTAATVVEALTFQKVLDENPVFFFGDGASKCKGIINHTNARFLTDIVPLASAMGELSFQKFQLQQVENLVTFEPIYLKEFLVKKPKSII